ncbi:arginine N-succinyltransferase [Sphingomicrobium astaxanthinifaciens]|uniref:arginine N-succinyltransferase n=1 Tax=Sphingomicrobium astaxanthinifaciens TaxID=1227949 RepID=UPI001FCBE038|nr:arginine N-succinyltransferase [Sphingomicrobium astaxanthinifaciens]MCJ7420652.1 arginine N-succinyltransferase [Sphingomicrobium astaxanthinifaciens]
MTYVLRAAGIEDLDALYDLSKLTGGGFTNLPADRETLTARLERSDASFAREGESPDDDLYIFMLEEVGSGGIRGTCQVFGKVGVEQPFYSYRISTITQKSAELDRIFRNRLLSLCTDLEGASEVGGLFLHPAARAGGLGLLLARSRYLFIKQHRPRFGDKILAELRGVIDEGGHSHFWDAIGGRFFGMTFPEADGFNAIHGTQFIADLFPKTPIYVNMLPEAARSVIGQPHPSGRAAMRMLEKEGLTFEHYIDIFDGGPTMVGTTDQVASIRDSEWQLLGKPLDKGGEQMIVAAGRLKNFRCCHARGSLEDGELRMDATAMAALDVEPGDRVLAVSRR